MNSRPVVASAGALALALALAACGTDGDTQGGGGGASGADADRLDSNVPEGDVVASDAQSEPDAGADAFDGALADQAVEDASTGDAHPADSSGDEPVDATAEADLGDTGAGDAAHDASAEDAPDAADAAGDALPDAAADGPPDASGDAVSQDAPDTDSATDAPAGDGSDGSPGSDEVWVEIDYTSAYTPQSPDWSFSPTPGWGPAQWAMSGDTWPEAWDRFNNMTVEVDPIGRSLTIGSSSELQLMIGLEELVGYDSMVVRLEGRSKATSSGVQFDVYNPLNGCGASGQMSQDWTPDVVELDLGQCAVIGAGVQAVRVDPTNGSIALLRMRVTLRGAVW